MLRDLQLIVEELHRTRDLEESLNILVERVAKVLSLDVCSIYLRDQNGADFVLRATKGLNNEAVGVVRLAPGEGLIGLVAERREPVHVKDASSHPRFRYFPVTGEERMHAFLGVPVVNYREVIGVLVAQQRNPRLFEADEEAFMVTAAAQIAGALSRAVIAEGLRSRLAAPLLDQESSTTLNGVVAASGVVIARVAIAVPSTDLESIPDRHVTDPAIEEQRLHAAVSRVQLALRSGAQELALPEARALSEVYSLMLDSSLVGDIAKRLGSGLWAPAAIRDAIREHARVFETMADPYMAARAADIRDLGHRVVDELVGAEGGGLNRDFAEPVILVGREISVSDVARVPVENLAALVSVAGSPHSHASILARAMGIPALVQVSGLPLEQLFDRLVIVDAHHGQLIIDPPPALLLEYERLIADQARRSAEMKKYRAPPAITRDGVRVQVMVNTGIVSGPIPALAEGSDGVGLYRTEYPFLLRDTFPGEQEQVHMYREVLATFAPRPVTMRTLDAGGDKPLPYFNEAEENPFLGWRGVRATLDHPEIFLTQLRAMLRANAGLGNLRLLIPMISNMEEIDETIALLDRAATELASDGMEYNRPPLGVMIEVPALVYLVDAVALRVDFLAIGSNDLTQYILAVDRTNARVAGLFDSLHPAVLQAVYRILKAAQAADRPVTVCGDMAGDPLAAFILLGMGFSSFSMPTATFLTIKRMVITASQREAAAVAEQTLSCYRAAEVRALASAGLVAAGLSDLVPDR
jgi:phosphotransferase system enzyme I (PtsP)